MIFLLFLGCWALIRGRPWLEPLALTIEKLGYRKAGPFFPWDNWGVKRWLFLSYIPWLWFIPAALAAVIAFFGSRLRNLKDVPLSLWAAAGIMCAYTWIVQASFYFPKYTALVWPLLLISSLTFLKPKDFVKVSNKFRIFFFGFVLFWFALIFIFPHLDPLQLIPERRLFDSADNQAATYTLAVFHLVGIGVPVIGVALLIFYRQTSTLFFGLLVYFLLLSGSNVLRSHLSSQNTHYLYGEPNLKNAIARAQVFRQKLYTNQILTSAKDLAWALPDQAERVPLPYETVDSKIPEQSLLEFEAALVRTPVYAARLYGVTSPRADLELLSRLEKHFPCHLKDPSNISTFEWWWRPTADEGCADPR